MNTISEWLTNLETRGDSVKAGAAELWPRTPYLNIQAEIWRRVGASDYNLDDPRCRAASIIWALREMHRNCLVPLGAHILDVFCGDGVVLWQIQRALGCVNCYGVDLREYPEHVQARRAGVQIFGVPVQTLVRHAPPEWFDAVIMLNTFRGWEKADLPPSETLLPFLVLAWLRKNARYVFVTATDAQIVTLRKDGWWTFDIGPGEDATRLIGMFLGRST